MADPRESAAGKAAAVVGAVPPSGANGKTADLAAQLLPLLVPVLREEIERSLRQALGTALHRLADTLVVPNAGGAVPAPGGEADTPPAPRLWSPPTLLASVAAPAAPARRPETLLDFDCGPLPIPEAAPPPAAKPRRTELRLESAPAPAAAPPAEEDTAARAEALLRHGNIHVERGRLDEAVAAYTEAIALAPRHAVVHLNRGLAHARRKEHAAAAADAGRAIELDPSLTSAFFVRAAARAGLEEYEAALADLDHLLKLDPRNVLALNERGLVQVSRRAYERAVADYSQALALAPTFTLARFNRGIARRLQGDSQGALDDLNEVIRRNPATLVAYLQRGQVHLAGGDLAAAATDFGAVLAMNPQHAEARRLLAEVDAQRAARVKQNAAATEPEVSVPPPPKPAVPAARSTVLPAQRLRMACPHCGAEGQIRTDRLNRILQCRRCWKLFRVNADGVLVEYVPPALQESRWSQLRKRARWLLPMAASVALVASLGWIMLRPTAAPALPPLPAELEPRAQLLAQAWLKKDMFLMRRLTLPTHDRVLNAWAAYHPPPAVAGETPPALDIRVVQNKSEGAQVVVSLDHGGDKIQMTQVWEMRGPSWYFVPPMPNVEGKARPPARARAVSLKKK